jgi:hypothetical protein
MGGLAPQQPDKNPQNSTLFKVVPIISLVLAIVSLYVTMTIQWPTFFSQHPVQAAIAAVFLTIIIVITGLGILMLIANLLIKPLLTQTEIQIRGTFSRTWQRYCKTMSDYHQVFSPEKLTPDLNPTPEFLEIFVEPRVKQNDKLKDVLPTPITGKASPTTSSTDDGQSTPPTIHYFLTEEVFSRYNLLIILGSPGSGKTTLLQYLTLLLAKKNFYGLFYFLHPLWVKNKKRRYFNLSQSKLPRKIPLFLSLPDHITAISDDILAERGTFTLAHALQKDMEINRMINIPELERVKLKLQNGRCLVMLDGLDDIADSNKRRQVFRWIAGEINRYNQCRFLLTSRPQSFSGTEDLSRPGVMLMRLEILPFERSQIELFVSNMSTAVNEIRAEKTDPKVLLRRLEEKEDLWELARSPQLLAMSVAIYIYTASLPEKRVELYKQICDRLLSTVENEHEGDSLYQAEQLKNILQLLSYALMQEPQTSNIDIQDDGRREEIEKRTKEINQDMTLNEFLKMISDRTGLLEGKGKDGGPPYQLFHSTMKEYLTAAHLSEMQDGWKFLIDKVQQPVWKEIILLYCALGDASPIIDACLREQALELAFVCEKEALGITPEVLRKLDKQREMVTTETDSTRRSIIAKSRLEQRLRSMITLSKNTYISTEYITYCEYQIFLDEQQKLAKSHWPDHWSISSLAIDRGKEAALGVRSSDIEAFCQALTAIDRDGWLYRPPTNDESARIERDSNLTTKLKLVSNTGYFDSQQQFHWIAGTLNLQDIKDKVNDLLEEDRRSSVFSNVPSNLDISLNDARTLNDMLIQRINDDNTFKTICTDAIENALNRIPAQALDLSKFVEPYPFSDSINRKYVHMPDTQFDQAQRLTQELEKSLTSILSRKENISTDQATKEKLTIFRWSIRRYAWIIAHTLLYWSDHTSFAASDRVFQNRRLPQEAQAQYQRTLNYYLDLCTSFALLELRIKGEIDPWEGILLVRERL